MSTHNMSETQAAYVRGRRDGIAQGRREGMALAKGETKVVDAVATCSLPVSSVNALISRWRYRAALWEDKSIAALDENNDAKYRMARERAKEANQCAEELLAEISAANVRQPEENTNDDRQVR